MKNNLINEALANPPNTAVEVYCIMIKNLEAQIQYYQNETEKQVVWDEIDRLRELVFNLIR